MLYWDIGNAIVDRQQRLGWGESVVEALARDLRDAFPGTTGFSARNLRDMKRFFLAYSAKEIWRQAVAKSRRGKRPEGALPDVLADVPWGHHLLILNKVPAQEQRLFYLQGSSRFGWSRCCSTNSRRRRSSDR